MKKSLCILLSLLMFVVSMSAGITALADEVEIINPDAVSTPEVTKISTSSIAFTWSDSSSYYYEAGTSGYEVYSYNTSAKVYTLLKDIKATDGQTDYTYTAYNLKKATKYVFAVRAYTLYDDVKAYSEYSEKLYAATSPSETKIKSVKYVSTGKLKISWSAVSGVSGYFIEYSPSKSFPDDGRTCYIKAGAKTISKTISGLPAKKYYFRVRTFINYNGKSFCSDYSDVKSKKPKKGATVKQMINSIKSTTAGKKYIKEFTANGVDISKYKTTYDRIKAIYNWHSKNHKKYGWSCVGCNNNFNCCLAFLFMESGRVYDPFISMYAGTFKNSDGSLAEHKWSVVYLSGVPYIVDPRLQGYNSNKTGNTYFFITKGSAVGKKYIFRDYYGFYPVTLDKSAGYDYYAPYYSWPFVDAVKKPAKVTMTAKTGKGSIKLSWKKVGGAVGYQIQYSTKEDFSSATTVELTDAATLTKTIAALKNNKTYYIRMRAFKKVGNNRLYGFWNTKQKIKTK